MQVNCSELVLRVDNEKIARELLQRTLVLAREVGARAFLYLKDDIGRAYLSMIPDPRDTRFVVEDYNIKLVLENVSKYTTVPEHRLDKVIRLAPIDRDWPIMILGVYGGFAFFYNQHHMPELYPLLAELSYEFGAEVLPNDGGSLLDFQHWLTENGIDYMYDEDNLSIRVLERVIGS